MRILVNVRQTFERTSLSVGRTISLLAVAGAAILIIACGNGDGSQSSTATAVTNTSPTATTQPPPTSTPVPQPSSPAVPDPTDVPTEPEPTPTTETSAAIFEDDAEKSRAERLTTIWGWNTDFAHRTISLNELEIVLPKDRITPVDNPIFVSVADAPDYMDAREPVIALIIDGEARAYPLAILMWHEIVNDTVADTPVTVTFCPLCNTAITFDRIVDGKELTFGTSGMLRNSDLVMWDRQSESYWQQITGEALAGEFAADLTVLDQVPSSIIAWETFAKAYPNGTLLERPLNEFGTSARTYDNPPYAGYDNVDDQPFLFSGTLDGRLVATSRVLTIDGEPPVAYPWEFLAESPVLNDTVNGEEIVALFDDGTFSAFNDLFNEKQESGSVAVFSRHLPDQTLSFEASDGKITDIETGSTWNLAGVAVAGELEGTHLEPVVHGNHFWFAWAVFKPSTEIRDSIDDLG